MEVKTREEGVGVRRLTRRAILAACTLAVLMVVLVTCQRSDPIAPEGSIITVSANPQTVVSQGGLPGRAKITATLRSKNGSRLPDQEVTFSSTAGTLTPVAQTPILSDSQGQATCLIDTATGATVTAASGSITGSTTINVVSGNLSSISIDDVQPGDVSTCSDLITVFVSARDPNDNGVAGVTIVFTTMAIPNTTLLPGGFNPTQLHTDPNGEASSNYTINQSACSSSCSPSADPNSPNGGHCSLQIQAKDISGAFVSGLAQVTSSIR
jgi:hypothetical protein